MDLLEILTQRLAQMKNRLHSIQIYERNPGAWAGTKGFRAEDKAMVEKEIVETKIAIDAIKKHRKK